jgi:hypothetical protein
MSSTLLEKAKGKAEQLNHTRFNTDDLIPDFISVIAVRTISHN